MITNILEYHGVKPDELSHQNVAALLEFFKQQNEILLASMTTSLLVPAGTKINKVPTK